MVKLIAKSHIASLRGTIVFPMIHDLTNMNHSQDKMALLGFEISSKYRRWTD